LTDYEERGVSDMKKATLRGLTVLFTALFAISCIIMPANGASSWTIQTVDSTRDVGSGSSIVIDNLGQPWISYSDTSDSPDNHLKVAHFTGTTWETSIVDPTGDTATAIALDNTGEPVIAYEDITTYGLQYAKLVGTKWQIETVDPDCQLSSEISLIIDTAGKPHIAYVDRSDFMNSLLKYAVPSTSGWSIETVSEECLGSDTSAPSLQLDSAGKPYISYYNEDSNSLVLTKKVGATWTEETVASGDAEYPSLKLNSAGNPCISYVMVDGLHYAYFESGSWHREVVDSTVKMGYTPPLILDTAGYPHIAYYDCINTDLKYAVYDGATWQKETVDTTGDVGLYASLALDSSGYPYISYYDATMGDLKCAFVRIPLMPTPESDGAVVLLFSVAIAVGCFVGIKRKTK
jgi:hypothetical protein